MQKNGVYISSFLFPFLFQPTLISSKTSLFLSFIQKTGTDSTIPVVNIQKVNPFLSNTRHVKTYNLQSLKKGDLASTISPQA